MTGCHPESGIPPSPTPDVGYSPNISSVLCGRQDIRERLEGSKDPNSVCLSQENRYKGLTEICAYSRSQQSEGHKTKWQERMNKTRKELAVKKLQQELRQEKEDERRR